MSVLFFIYCLHESAIVVVRRLCLLNCSSLFPQSSLCYERGQLHGSSNFRNELKCVCVQSLAICCLVLAAVGIVKSRDMHWGMLAKKDHKDIDLKSLRLLLVADGANPCM